MPDAPKAATRDLSALRIDRGPEQRRRRVPGWLIAFAVVAGVAAVALPLARRSGIGRPEVTLALATLDQPQGGGQTVLAASGYVVARTKASVSAKTAGRLESLAVEEGSVVAEGDIIARLESDALRADHRAAVARVAQAEAAVARARADREVARVDFDRQAKLLDAGLGTASASDTARAVLAAREAGVSEAVSGLAATRAGLVAAEVGLENANVRAPFAGVVLRKEAEVGEYVAPSVASSSLTRGAIVTMADLGSLEVEADVAEGNVARLLPDMPAEISLDAVPDRRYRGRLRQIMPTADRQKATVQVKVALLDPDDRVKPEMSAKVRFLSAEPDEAALKAPPAVTVPAASVLTDGSTAAVLAVADERLRRMAITLGERRGDRVVVTAGLAGGEALVLNPSPDMRTGDRVKVAP